MAPTQKQTSIADELLARAAAHTNAALRAFPGSAERAIEERLAQECREIREFVTLREGREP